MTDDGLTASEAFAQAVEEGRLPVAIPIEVDDEPAAVVLPFGMSGRVRATALSPDRTVRARLAVGLCVVARDRVMRDLGELGIIPA